MLKCFCRILTPQLTLHKILDHSWTISSKRVSTNFNIVTANVHTASVFCAKVFKDTENLYAFDVLQTIPVNTAVSYTPKSLNKALTATEEFNKLLDQDFRKASVSDIVQAFKNALHYCVTNNIAVSDHRFDKLVDGLMDNIEHLNDQDLYELLSVLAKFPPCENYTSHNFHDIWSALDDACLHKMTNWDTDTMFNFAELWFQLNLGKLSDYNYEMLDRMDTRASAMRLTKSQIIHTFFYHNLCRRKEITFELQYALEQYVNEMSADELAVIAMGFFKTQTKIKLPSIYEAMCNKIIQEHGVIHEISLAAILKTLRLSSLTKCTDLVYEVLENLLPEIDRLSNLCCIHVALLGTNLQIYNQKILKTVADKLIKDIGNTEKLRLKDIERLLLAVTMFGYDPKTNPDLFESSLKELYREERRPEISRYPRSLGCTLQYLSLNGVYSYEFLDKVLDAEFISTVYGKHIKCVPRELFVLDSNIDIDCPDYRGNRLTSKAKQKAAKWLTEYIPRRTQYKTLSSTDKYFLDVSETVLSIVGDEKYLFLGHVLPQFAKGDVVLCKNTQTGEFIVPEKLSDYKLWDIKYPSPDKNTIWFAIIPLAWNNTVRHTTTPLGLMNVKAKQLKKIGYHPVFVPWCDFTQLSSDLKQDYIRSKLQFQL